MGLIPATEWQKSCKQSPSDHPDGNAWLWFSPGRVVSASTKSQTAPVSQSSIAQRDEVTVGCSCMKACQFGAARPCGVLGGGHGPGSW